MERTQLLKCENGFLLKDFIFVLAFFLLCNAVAMFISILKIIKFEWQDRDQLYVIRNLASKIGTHIFSRAK